MDPSFDLVEHFKLASEFLPEVIQHTSYTFDRSKGLRRVKVVKRWSRREVLGEGSFGTVWLEVEDNGSKRAVKEISRRMCLKNTIDYKKELATMANLSRHNDFFVEFFGWFENKETVFLAMEHFEYGDLQRYINEKLSEPQIKIIIVQLLEGLKVMHGNGFTHRDLKPQNIFVVTKDPFWWVKIGDFGITKRVLNEETFLRTEIGTRDYLAPEVIGYVEEDEEKYTNGVDIWSLGCICHRLLTHQLPFANLRALAPYCLGRSELPIEERDKYGVSDDSISFIKGVMAAQPAERWDANSALQSLWLRDVTDEGQSLNTLAQSTSKILRSPSQEIDHNRVRDLIQDMRHTSIRPREEQRLQEDITPSSVETLELGRSAPKPPQETKIIPSREIEIHGLNADSTTIAQRNSRDHQVGNQTEINEYEAHRQDGLLASTNIHGYPEGTGYKEATTTIRKASNPHNKENKKAKKEQSDKATREDEAEVEAKSEAIEIKKKIWQEKKKNPNWRLFMSEAEFGEMRYWEEEDIRRASGQRTSEKRVTGKDKKSSAREAYIREELDKSSPLFEGKDLEPQKDLEQVREYWQKVKKDPNWRLHMSEAEFERMLREEEWGFQHAQSQKAAKIQLSKADRAPKVPRSKISPGKALPVREVNSSPIPPRHYDSTVRKTFVSPTRQLPENASTRKGLRALLSRAFKVTR